MIISRLLPLCFLGATASLLAVDRAPARPVNLNTATATELTQLPKVGAVTARRIVEFRKQHGAFRRVEDLLNVKGIGEKSFLKLKPHLTVGASTAPAAR